MATRTLGPKITELLEALQTVAEERASARLRSFRELRVLLDDYETAVRESIENELTQQLGAALSLELPVGPSRVIDARARLAVALEDVRGALTRDVDKTKNGEVREANLDDEGKSARSEGEEDAPPSKPVSRRELDEYFERLRTEAPRARLASPDPIRALKILQRWVTAAGEPPVVDDVTSALSELDTLDELTREEHWPDWDFFSTEITRLWIGMLVARGRAIRDRIPPMSTSSGRFRDIIVRLPTYASRRRPGFINGMTPKHEPRGLSWRADAVELLGELRRLAGDDDDGGGARGRSATTRSSSSAKEPSKDAPPPKEAPSAADAPAPSSKDKRPDASSSVPPASDDVEGVAWPLRGDVENMRVLMFGGTPREDARTNIERALGIGSLEWPPSEKPRKVEALAEQISSGSFGVVLINRLVRHTESNKLVGAAKASGTPFAMVDTGYGVDAVRLAIESALRVKTP